MTILINTLNLAKIIEDAGTQFPQNDVERIQQFLDEALKDYEFSDEERRALQRYAY